MYCTSVKGQMLRFNFSSISLPFSSIFYYINNFQIMFYKSFKEYYMDFMSVHKFVIFSKNTIFLIIVIFKVTFSSSFFWWKTTYETKLHE